MFYLISTYWPHILFVISLAMGAAAAIHAAMTKEEVRAAIGWVGVIILSPIVGAVLYAIAGINRIRRKSLSLRRDALLPSETLDELESFDAEPETVISGYGRRFAALQTLGDRITNNPLTTGNTIDVLETGDDAYAAMKAAIDTAERSILLETYIFDRDKVGIEIADALITAVKRGVEVRVLIDAVGARYSVPSILGYLGDGGVRVSVFNGNVIMGLRLPYANLRTHRKILIVDGRLALTGGMNIREGFSQAFVGDDFAHDTHFSVTGSAVADLFDVAAEDWRFTTGEVLNEEAWRVETPERRPGDPVFMRVVASGPDRSLETNHKMLMGAFSVARKSIRIMSPYFLPDRELISALTTAARRGVEVDIVVPAVNNLLLVDRAMTAQFDQILKNYCRIWRATGSFNHSKLLTVDGVWAYVGSSNLDPRSLRLNFEVDLEVLNEGFATEIDEHIDEMLKSAVPVTLKGLRARPFPVRLVEKILWLGSPYL
ncbi:phosphatidylserine/phosphatidylglycerophosphate/cardiolipin synthase family protein [Rhizobium sp. P32RR-XVIII]|uniref:phospholipase D-like domain-containing protein n=1 Tax=Rhizobium sp. P32RR-XVIII TaxID=2726738 RepID=UPI00145689C2|nr:phosphatidylserine/phosphatidylglycerophosphate/cardiolipin synthase family protein [Rhizobium sp. P32RR-XVIII]NLS04024.1 phosphatidylserine/phosphatidylglycerophosphate/cardiolipin synthase family protein [Rhizobium sp. P32RR-XVIII]